MFRHRSGNGPNGAQRRGGRESAASGLAGGDPDAALHTGLGTLGERQTRFLILRADCQRTVRRVAALDLAATPAPVFPVS